MYAVQGLAPPALNLERASQVNTAVLNGNMRKGSLGNGDLIFSNVPFPAGEAGGGSIVVRPDLKPVTEGPVRVPFIGLGKLGFAAVIMDSEGNKIGHLSHEK